MIKRLDNKQCIEVQAKDGVVLVSYETPVACIISHAEAYKTDKKWSTTTSRHISQWFASHGLDAKNVPTKPQTWFDNLLSLKLLLA